MVKKGLWSLCKGSSRLVLPSSVTKTLPVEGEISKEKVGGIDVGSRSMSPSGRHWNIRVK